MSIILATSYHPLAATKFQGVPPTYQRVVEATVEHLGPGKPKGHRQKETKRLEAGKMGVCPIREQSDRRYQTYLALCRRTRKVPLITEPIVVGIYVRYLPEQLGVQVRELALDAQLETLYTADKVASARADRRSTHPLLRDMVGLPSPRGDAAGLLMISGESVGSGDPTFAARELRAAGAHTANRAAHRHGGGFYVDGTKPPASYRRHEGFPDPPGRPTVMPSHLQPRRYTPMARFAFKDAQGQDQGRPMPRNPAVRRPPRWLQVDVMNVHLPPPGLHRLIGPDYDTSTPRRAFDLPSPAGAGGWYPCFACGQTGNRLMNCTRYLQERAQDSFRRCRFPACSPMGLRPADCRRRLYFAACPYPHLELNKDCTSFYSVQSPDAPVLSAPASRRAGRSRPCSGGRSGCFGIPGFLCCSYRCLAASCRHGFGCSARQDADERSDGGGAYALRPTADLVPGNFRDGSWFGRAGHSNGREPCCGCFRRQRSGRWVSADAPRVCCVVPL